jgi:hypothetical protein
LAFQILGNLAMSLTGIFHNRQIFGNLEVSSSLSFILHNASPVRKTNRITILRIYIILAGS